MNLPFKTQIITHISYRAVFNAPVPITSLKLWLGVNTLNETLFENAKKELILEKLIDEKNGYLFMYGKSELADNQKDKDKLTEKLLLKGEKFLAFFAKLPFVKFVGVSGSLAAKNPTIYNNRSTKQGVDMDLFVISSPRTLWIIILIERIITNFNRIFFNNYFYCFNYVTDATFLEVYNKNFFTATELVNLLPIYDTNIYQKLIAENKWYSNYYSSESIMLNDKKADSTLASNVLLAPINYIFFAFFCITRAVKRLELAPLFEMSIKFNPTHKSNLKRLSSANGGYQEAITEKFDHILAANFSAYYSVELIEMLFPTKESFKMSIANTDDSVLIKKFEKYSLPTNEKNTF